MILIRFTLEGKFNSYGLEGIPFEPIGDNLLFNRIIYLIKPIKIFSNSFSNLMTIKQLCDHLLLAKQVVVII